MAVHQARWCESTSLWQKTAENGPNSLVQFFFQTMSSIGGHTLFYSGHCRGASPKSMLSVLLFSRVFSSVPSGACSIIANRILVRDDQHNIVTTAVQEIGSGFDVHWISDFFSLASSSEAYTDSYLVGTTGVFLRGKAAVA